MDSLEVATMRCPVRPAGKAGATGQKAMTGSHSAQTGSRVPDDGPPSSTHTQVSSTKGLDPLSTGTSRPGEERRQRAGFLTCRFDAKSAAFSKGQCPCNGAMAVRSPVTVAGAVPDWAGVASLPDFPIKPLRAPVTPSLIWRIDSAGKASRSHNGLATRAAPAYPAAKLQVPREGIERERGSRPWLPLQL